MNKTNKNLRYWIIFILVIILFVCIGSFIFKGITGNAVLASYSITKYAPPYNLSNSSDYFFTISSNFLVASEDIVNLTANVSIKGGYIYQKGYVYNQRTFSWEVFNFDQSPVENSYWIKDFASKDLIINVSNNVHNSSETYIVAYACQKDSSGNWKCGCQSESETGCKRWMLHKFNITNITISPDVNCTSDANCTVVNGTCNLDRGICVSESVNIFPLGTPENPFKITSWVTLDAVRNNLTASYILMNNLDKNSVNYSDYNTGAGWEPIGNGVTDYDFNGLFNGNGKTISGLYLNRPTEDFVGLFGSMVEEGNISNLNVEDFNFTGFDYSGGLVGYNRGGVISACSAQGVIYGSGDVGGLVGYNEGLISNSHTTIFGNISASDFVGGLVGDNEGVILSSYSTISGAIVAHHDGGGLVGSNSGEISNSYSNISGNIFTSASGAGGLVGFHPNGEISSSYAIISGNISGSAGQVGGLVGVMGSVCVGFTCIAKISSSYAIISGKVSATSESVGGLVGYSNMLSNNISSSYAIISGNILAANNVGGLIGSNNGEVSNSYATLLGNISVSSSTSGGFAGSSSGMINNSSVTISGKVSATQTTVGGFVGDNTGSIVNSSAIVSGVIISSSYYAGGLVGENKNYGTILGSSAIISGNISANYAAGGLVGRNIATISNSSVTISGKVSATSQSAGGVAGHNNGGTILGSSAIISGNISTLKYAGGFVGMVDASGTISNSSVTVSGNISATSESAGGFIGYNSQTTTSNCYALISGRVSATSNYAGGFVGYNAASGAVTNSYAKSETTSYISSPQYAGGFVGYKISGTISKSYAVRKGTGTGYGFAGGGTGITSSYYDNSVFLQDSSGANSKSSYDMKLQSTYFLWDFSNTWLIDFAKNNGYPYLRWQAL